MGHRSAEDYGKFALEAAKLMKWTDPTVKLIAAGSSNFGPGSDWTGWNRTVLEYLKQHADYLSLHIYVGNPRQRFRRFHGQFHRTRPAHQDRRGHHRRRPLRPARQSQNLHRLGRMECLVSRPRQRSSAAAASWKSTTTSKTRSSSPPSSTPSSITPTSSRSPTWRNWSTSSRPSSATTRASSCRPSTIRWQLFANHAKGKALRAFRGQSEVQDHAASTTCPTSTSPPPIDNGPLVINAVNRHPDQSLGADFELEDKQFSGPVAVSEVNGPNIKSENDFDKTTVKTVERTATAEGRRLRYTFPPHSYTMLKVETV